MLSFYFPASLFHTMLYLHRTSLHFLNSCMRFMVTPSAARPRIASPHCLEHLTLRLGALSIDPFGFHFGLDFLEGGMRPGVIDSTKTRCCAGEFAGRSMRAAHVVHNA